ncbi:MAG: efflux RND transporter periplasmic adaptor subunit [Deltaproteobacteria bacterium]|nr:efflux RND transporter periplasmic adaptor subunit [Deltaproteobacteria bacterium]
MRTARHIVTTALALLALATSGCGKGEGHAQDEHDHAREGDHGEGDHGEGEHGEGEIHLDPAGLARADLAVATVEARVLAGDARIPAEVRLVPQRTAHVAPLSPGRLVRVDAQPGQAVKAGDTLAVVSSSEVATLAARGEQLRAQLAAARATHERQKKLAVDGIASQRVVIDAESLVRQLQAEAAGVARQLELLGAKEGRPELALVSPIDGIIVDAHATLGEMTRNDEPPFVVSDPSLVWVIGLVPELAVRDVAVGKLARLRLGAYPGEHWQGPIEFVSPSLDEGARALPIRLSLPNPDGRLRAGLFGTLEILSGEASETPAAAVPVGALVTIEGRDAVFVPGQEPGAFEPRFVGLGRREAGWVEVTSGLAVGDRLVVRGAFTLKSALDKGALAEHEH